MDIALIGDNEFLKTTPDEVERFTKFIDETAPYDIVLDGLNVAFRTHARPTVNEKAETVSNLIEFNSTSICKIASRFISVSIGSYALCKTGTTHSPDRPRAYEQMATKTNELYSAKFDFLSGT